MKEADRRTVRERARERCEYCLLPVEFSVLPFEIDHIIAEKHSRQGPTIRSKAHPSAPARSYWHFLFPTAVWLRRKSADEAQNWDRIAECGPVPKYRACRNFSCRAGKMRSPRI